MFNPSHIAAAVLMFAAIGAQAEVYKWTDDKGRVHYSDQPPPTAPAAAKKPIQLHTSEPSDEERQQAAERLARQRANLHQESGDKSATGDSAETPPARPEEDNSCAAQKRRYEESAACFQRYRNANGSVKAEAYEHCVSLPPPNCE